MTARYVLDASHSHVSFSVRHLMISNVRGEFSKFSGEATYDPANPSATSVSVSIEVDSIGTRDAQRDGHLKSPDFFDVANHPTMTFKSKSVSGKGENLTIVGDLTIRGTSHEVTLAVEDVTPERADPWGNIRVGATARTRIKRSDYGIVWNAALEAGGVVVGDEVKIELEVEFIKQK